MAKRRPAGFEKKIVVRPLTMADYDQLVEVQKLCFPGMKPWTVEQLESQFSIFPEGQICIEYKGKIVASSSSLILDFDLYKDWHSWTEIADAGYIRNHDQAGDTMYGIEIMVHPKFRGMRLARRLYEARKNLARDMNLKRIVIGGRIPGYGKHAKKMSARQYVEKVKEKVLIDPVLTTQVSNGFVLKRLIPNYMTSDKESQGYATFLEWTNLDYVPDSKEHLITVVPVRLCVVQYQMRTIRSFEEFAEQCSYFVDVASDYKGDFVLFPEMVTTQMLSFIKAERPAIAMRLLSEHTEQYLEMFSRLAIKHDINIIGGTHFIVEDDKLFNAAYLFRRDGSIDRQDKLHITPEERRWWGVTPGSRLDVFDTDKGKIAILICYDVEFPELARIAVEQGAQILFVPFNTDERNAYLRVRYCAQARCIENHVYTAIAGCVGNLPFAHNIDVHYAQSGIFTPSDFPFSRDGVAAECNANIETMIVQDVDLEQLRRHRQSGSVLNWKDRRPELYSINYTPTDEPKH